MAIEVMKAEETDFNGDFIIATSEAYRGCGVYVSGWDSTYNFAKVDLIGSSANAKVAVGLVHQLPMVNTGADTADAVDKLTKNTKVVVLQKGTFRVWGNAIVATSFTTLYRPSAAFGAVTDPNVLVASAYYKNAYPSIKANQKGRWTCTSAAADCGYTSGTSLAYFGNKAKVLELVSHTSPTGNNTFVVLDVDFTRTGDIESA